jgi:phage tail sheath gpL-like
MSAAPVPVSATSSLYDFTTAQTQAFGTTPMVLLSAGVFGMYAGDVTANGTIKYSGSGNDSGPIYSRIGGASVSVTVPGYFPEDTNMNGVVKYSGAQNDRAIIYLNIGGSSVSVTRSTQVPL